MKHLIIILTLFCFNITSYASFPDMSARNCFVSKAGTMNFEDSYYAMLKNRPKPYYFLSQELIQVLESKGYSINDSNNRVSSFVLKLDAKDESFFRKYKSADINFDYHILEKKFPVAHKEFSVGPFQEAGSHRSSVTKKNIKNFIHNLPDCNQALEKIQRTVVQFKKRLTTPSRYSCQQQANLIGVLTTKLGLHYCSKNPRIKERKDFFQCTGSVAQINSLSRVSYFSMERGFIGHEHGEATYDDIRGHKFLFTLRANIAYQICSSDNPASQKELFNKCIEQLKTETIQGVTVHEDKLVQGEIPLLRLGKNKASLCKNQIKDRTSIEAVKKCTREYEDPLSYIYGDRYQTKSASVVESEYHESKSFSAEICIANLES